MRIPETICALCLKVCENFKALEGDMKDVLGVLMPKIDLTAIRKPLMCTNCTETLIKCFDFKTTCFYTFDYIVPFINDKNDAKLDLKDVYLSKNGNGTGILRNKEICGFCMDPVKICSSIPLDLEEEDLLNNMIEQCLPELDFSIIKNPVICAPCHGSLEDCFRFVTTCLTAEENIKKYCKTLDINNRDLIELNSVLQFTIKNVISEPDGNPVNLIEAEELCEEGDGREIVKGRALFIKLERIFCDESENVEEEVDCKNQSFMNIDDSNFNNDRQFSSRNVTTYEDKSDVIRLTETFSGENETQPAKGNSVEMEDQKCLFNEEIEIKTDDQDFNRFENNTRPPERTAISEATTYSCAACSFKTIHKRSLKKHSVVHKDPSEIKMYNCDSCSFQTKYPRNVKRHALKHKRPDLYREECKKRRESRSLKRKNPSKATAYKCDSCSYQTCEKYRFQRHLLVHKSAAEVTLYGCDECSFQSKYERSLENHLLIHKNPTEVAMYNCYYCKYQTKIKNYLKVHLLRHKDVSEVATYNCASCSYRGKFKADLKNHSLVHKSSSEVTVHRCDTCSFETKHERSLKNHSLLHKNPLEVATYSCASCTYRTKNKSHLKSHLLRHKDISEVTTYDCPSCSYQAKVKNDLKDHMLKHKDSSEVKMQKCPTCPFQTKYKKSLKGHLLKHEDPSKVAMYECNVCTFRTKYGPSLRTHLLQHKYPEATADSCQKKHKNSIENQYKCNSCSFQTKFKGNLRKHLLKHEDPSRATFYKCDACSYQTAYKNNLRKHFLKHKDPSKVTLYKCDSCSLQTRHKTSFKKHLQKHKDFSEVKTYNCGSCSYTTRYKTSFETHLLTHKHKAQLTTPVPLHGGRSEVKCDFCSYQTSDEKSLRKHFLVHKDLITKVII